MRLEQAFRALWGIALRELMRFVYQRERFIAALVRPLIWLFVFAAGFRAALGVSITPPYQTYVTYETYIVPGLVGMIQLFNGMQSSLSMVYDREMGSMRILLTSPLPRPFLLLSKLLAGALVSVLQAYVFLGICAVYGVVFPLPAYLLALPVLIVTGLALGAIGLFLSSMIHQLENFAGVMNFVIFPMFFLSSALYPLWKMKEGSHLLYWICAFNPFSHIVEFVRFSLYLSFNGLALGVTAAVLVGFALLSIMSFDPRFNLVKRQVS